MCNLYLLHSEDPNMHFPNENHYVFGGRRHFDWSLSNIPWVGWWLRLHLKVNLVEIRVRGWDIQHIMPTKALPVCVCVHTRVCGRPQRATQVCQHVASNSVASGHRRTLPHFYTHSALWQENTHTRMPASLGCQLFSWPLCSACLILEVCRI